jgi:hypothetical protein
MPYAAIASKALIFDFDLCGYIKKTIFEQGEGVFNIFSAFRMSLGYDLQMYSF